MGHRLQVEWAESAELKMRYRQEKQIQRRERLLVLWHLREGKRVEEVAALSGTGSCRVIQRWLSWYREGGIGEVLHRVTGHATRGQAPYLGARFNKGPGRPCEIGGFRNGLGGEGVGGSAVGYCL
ncbi:MAG: helix-turn-helix domain-containing protein [Chloroflexi bacterium]|nr:helix-turn-helix domain-containing protein [Chloroflexota bacterium]